MEWWLQKWAAVGRGGPLWSERPTCDARSMAEPEGGAGGALGALFEYMTHER